MVTVTSCAPPPVDRGEVFRYAACRRPGAEEERLLDSCLEELGDRLRYAVCFTTVPVTAGGGRLDLGFAQVESRDLARWLDGAPARREMPLTLVSQTTLTQEVWDKCVEKAKKECTNLKRFDTICNATYKRQS